MEIQETYSESEKAFLLEKHKELGNWSKIAEAFHDKFKSKADVTIPQLQYVLSRWEKKLAIEAGETPRTKQVGKKFTNEEYEFLVRERSNTTKWPTIEKLFRSRFPGRESATGNNLGNLFWNLKMGD
jgi:hypothetical protein